jgi:hypothetical protein
VWAKNCYKIVFIKKRKKRELTLSARYFARIWTGLLAGNTCVFCYASNTRITRITRLTGLTRLTRILTRSTGPLACPTGVPECQMARIGACQVTRIFTGVINARRFTGVITRIITGTPAGIYAGVKAREARLLTGVVVITGNVITGHPITCAPARTPAGRVAGLAGNPARVAGRPTSMAGNPARMTRIRDCGVKGLCTGITYLRLIVQVIPCFSGIRERIHLGWQKVHFTAGLFHPECV